MTLIELLFFVFFAGVGAIVWPCGRRSDTVGWVVLAASWLDLSGYGPGFTP
jgi:hypothetical protein